MIQNKLSVIISISLNVVIWMVFLNNVTAQNTHYWTQQYGNKSLLLSGAVTGSVEDLGSVFYNPGALALQNNPSFVISAKVLQYSTLSILDGLGDGVDLEQSNFGDAPGLIAGTFDLKFIPKHHFAYSILTRRTLDLDFLFRTQSTVDILKNSPGEEVFNGEVNLVAKSKETWFGLTWSYAPSKKWSFGITNFVTVSDKNSILDIDLNAMASDNHVVTLSKKRNLEYNHTGLLWKGGVSVDLSPVTLGLTVTTPKVDLKGNGFYLSETILAGADTNYIKTGDDKYETNFEKDIDVQLKSSWAVAVGAGFTIKKFVIHLNAEWFDAVDKYSVMTPTSFIGQSTGDTISTNLIERLDDVINFGIGLEWKMKENISLYGSFATDFSAAAPDPILFAELQSDIDNSTFRANIFHFAGGAGFTVKRMELTLGTSFNFAKDEIARPVNIPDDGKDEIFDPNKTSTIKIQTWKILLGFSMPLSKPEDKK